MNPAAPHTVLSVAFRNMRTVSSLALQPLAAKLFAASTARGTRARISRCHISGIAFGFGQATQFFIYALLFW
jgi:hypothetical protein